MKKRHLIALAALMLSGCGGTDTQNTTVPSVTTASQETTTQAEVSQETTTEVAETEPAAPAETTEDFAQMEEDILSGATLLFSGAENEGYYPGDIEWLKSAEGSDIVAIRYSCDDKSHGGWGVLGLKVGSKQTDISAYSDMPDKVRTISYTVDELCDMAKVDSAADISGFSLGAWNGGHIHGLYFLSGDAAANYSDYLVQLAEATAIKHTYDGTLSNPDAIENAVTLYKYLKDTWGTACITGQMESTWMGSPDYEMNYIEKNSGKLPAIRGLDFMHNDFDGVANRSIAWWDKGGIVTICWHTGADFASGYNECKADNIDWDEAFTEGTDTYNALLAGMDRAVPALLKLEDAGVPVLWRPFHELDGGWFWWSKGGSENFVKLWQMMYDRYTNYWELDNLIWVYAYSHNGTAIENWYPGDEYVDLIGGDSYDAGANGDLYDTVEELAAPGMPIVFHECGNIPTEEQMKNADAPWLFFMTWHTDYITNSTYNSKDAINAIYNSDYFITLDELPSFE
ncbi:MAG: glycoside hydrolase family 26 protein [Lachnospiraceae bacterium]|nr:glycoside hydrolase family 26 protein [Lachnospiraceae bacterium]